MNFEFMKKIVDNLNKNPRGLTIKNLVDNTKLSRGTIRPLLDILVYTSQVNEIKYAQNVKVYHANVKRLTRKVEVRK